MTSLTIRLYVFLSRKLKPKNPNLFYASSVCTPGNYQSKYKHAETLVSCVFEKSEGVEIANEVHVTPL